jgi:hypothetical protein
VHAVDGLALRRPTSPIAPHAEALETRSCPSVSAVASGHTLVIQGDHSADLITINDGGDGHVWARISAATGSAAIDAAGIDTILVNTGDGHDTAFYTLRGDLTQNLNLEVHLGAGQDRVDTSLLPDVSGGRVNIDVEGGTGRDLVTGRFGNITDSNLTVRTQLGSGGGAFNYYLHGDVLGHARARFLGMGGAADNTASLHAEGVHVDAGALLEADLRGGTGDGLSAFGFQGRMDGLMKVRSYGATSSARLATIATFAAGSGGVADLGMRGAGARDRMTFFVQDHSRDPVDAWSGPLGQPGLGSLRAVAEGIAGEGVLYHTANVQPLRCAVDEVFAHA